MTRWLSFKGLFSKFKLWFVGPTLVAMLSTSQPLGVDANTVAYWTLDESSGSLVSDLTENPLNGTVTSAAIASAESIGLPTEFGNARDFTAPLSRIDFGFVTGSKLDFQGKQAASIEAVVRLHSDAPDIYTVFDNRQLLLQVINNRIAAFVRQRSGFQGAIAKTPMLPNTNYRVGLWYQAGYLAVVVNDYVEGRVELEEDIAGMEASARAYVGGDPSGSAFPGVIDDVRVSDVARGDILPPVVELVTPDLSAPVATDKPVFTISYSDNVAIDGDAVRIYLNGQRQFADADLVIDGSKIQGRFNSPLVFGMDNVVRIEVSDATGNTAVAVYNVLFDASVGIPYDPDPSTLGLWHLDEFDQDVVEDSSSFARNGMAYGSEVVPGVFGLQRRFIAGRGPKISLPSISIPGRVFTFEGWWFPGNLHPSGGMTLFDNGQLQLTRIEEGRIRIKLRLSALEYSFETVQVVLKSDELHHLKVIYDGNRPDKNLVIQVDGIAVATYDAPAPSDFAPAAVETIMAGGFIGHVDELRLSSVVRQQTNLRTSAAPRIFVVDEKPEGVITFSQERPNILVLLEDSSGISVENIDVRLNGILQEQSAEFEITGERIEGIMPDSLNPGLNVFEVRATNAAFQQTYRKLLVYYLSDGGLQEYFVDADTVGLWHLNDADPNRFEDSSGNALATQIFGGTPSVIGGKFGLGRGLNSATVRISGIAALGSEFLIEGWLSTYASQVDRFNIVRLFCTTTKQLVLNKDRFGRFGLVVRTPDGIFTHGLTATFPDDVVHHFAIQYVGTRQYAQLVLFINGRVYAQVDTGGIPLDCSESSPILDLSSFNFVDEVRISRGERFQINHGLSSGSEIRYALLSPESTSHVANPDFEYWISDTDGIDNSSIELRVNGVPNENIVFTNYGTRTKINGSLGVPLSPGSNLEGPPEIREGLT